VLQKLYQITNEKFITKFLQYHTFYNITKSKAHIDFANANQNNDEIFIQLEA